MNCAFCCYPIREDKGLTLADEMVYGLIDTFRGAQGLEYLCLSQFNEPLMDHRIFDFIKYSMQKGISIQIITNGTLFSSKQIIHKLINSNPWVVKVSLQTLNPTLFKNARKCDVFFDHYKLGIFEFLKSAVNSKMTIFVDIACNFHTPLKSLRSRIIGLEAGDPSVYNYLGELKNDLKTFLKEFYSYVQNSSFFDEDKIDEWLRRVSRDYSNNPGFKINDNAFLKIKPFYYGRRLSEFFPLKNTSGCKNRILSVLASGNVVPCCMAYGEILSLGNIKHETLEKILIRNKELLAQIKNGKNLPLHCARCMGAPTKRAIPLKALKYSLRDIF